MDEGADELIPPGMPRLVDMAPPAVLQHKLENLEQSTLCGGRFVVKFTSGEWRGQEVSAYCAEPLCITERVCTGPRFVPHPNQVPRDPSPDGAKRWMRLSIAVVRECAKKATGKDDKRTDDEIVRHLGMTWRRALQEWGQTARKGRWAAR